MEDICHKHRIKHGMHMRPVTNIRLFRKVLGMTFVMVPLCPSSECGCSQIPALVRLSGLLMHATLVGCTEVRSKHFQVCSDHSKETQHYAPELCSTVHVVQ